MVTGEVSTSDVRDMLHLIVGDATYRAVANVNFDGVVNTADVSAVLKAVIHNSDPVFVKPHITQLESVPTGEAIPFSFAANGEKYAELGKSINDAWIAQSLDELRACYAYSYGRVDYSDEYTEAFFDNNAVIVWDVYYMDTGLMRAQPGKIIKNGTNLCLVTSLLYTTEAPMPYAEMRRYIIEVSKEDLAGIETVSRCTEIIYE